MSNDATTCECDAPRCERDGCQDTPTPCVRCKGTRVIPVPGPEWFITCPECDGTGR